jgi:hypothetical protein
MAMAIAPCITTTPSQLLLCTLHTFLACWSPHLLNKLVAAVSAGWDPRAPSGDKPKDSCGAQQDQQAIVHSGVKPTPGDIALKLTMTPERQAYDTSTHTGTDHGESPLGV